MHYENSPWPRTGEAPDPGSARVRLENGHEPDHELAHGLRHVYFLIVLFCSLPQGKDVKYITCLVPSPLVEAAKSVRGTSTSRAPRSQEYSHCEHLTTKTIWTGDFRKAKSRCRTAYTLDYCGLHFVEARSELVCSFDQRSLRITTLSYVRQFASENKHDAGAESYTGGD